VLWWLLLTGCWEPTETSESGMVGRILDNTGFPVKGVEVYTLEGRSITDENGHFAVEYQAPNTHADFDIGVTTFRRAYRTQDDGGSVDVQLPRLHEVQLSCDIACGGRVVWDLGEAVTARAAIDCDANTQHPIIGIPVGPPTLECRGQAASLTIEDDVWRITAPPRRVTVSGLDGACRVSVGGVMAVREGDVFVASAQGPVVVRGQCDDGLLIPTRVEGDSVLLSASAPETWTLPGVTVGSVSILAQPVSGESWTMEVVVENGQITTPTLPPGAYAFLASDALPMDRAALLRATSEHDINTVVPTGEGRTAVWVMHRE